MNLNYPQYTSIWSTETIILFICLIIILWSNYCNKLVIHDLPMSVWFCLVKPCNILTQSSSIWSTDTIILFICLIIILWSNYCNKLVIHDLPMSVWFAWSNHAIYLLSLPASDQLTQLFYLSALSLSYGPTIVASRQSMIFWCQSDFSLVKPCSMLIILWLNCLPAHQGCITDQQTSFVKYP
jgi:hypothetical protein